MLVVYPLGTPLLYAACMARHATVLRALRTRELHAAGRREGSRLARQIAQHDLGLELHAALLNVSQTASSQAKGKEEASSSRTASAAARRRSRLSELRGSLLGMQASEAALEALGDMHVTLHLTCVAWHTRPDAPVPRGVLWLRPESCCELRGAGDGESGETLLLTGWGRASDATARQVSVVLRASAGSGNGGRRANLRVWHRDATAQIDSPGVQASLEGKPAAAEAEDDEVKANAREHNEAMGALPAYFRKICGPYGARLAPAPAKSPCPSTLAPAAVAAGTDTPPPHPHPHLSPCLRRVPRLLL